MTPGILEVWLEYYPIFLKGMLGTLKYAAIAVAFGSVLGSLVARVQMNTNKLLMMVGRCYVTVLRGTPLLVQMYIAYFFIPMAFPALNYFSKEQYVLFALIINSVDKGQFEAARSLGMSKRHCMTHIILPQAVKAILPALAGEYISMIKETSMAGTFMLYELMYTKVLLANKFLICQPLFIIAFIYLFITSVLTWLTGLLEKRLAASD